MVDGAACDHEAGVKCASGNSSKRVPCSYPSHCVSKLEHAGITYMGFLTVVKPIPKAIESILYQILRRPEIEPRINWEALAMALVVDCSVLSGETDIHG